MKKPWRTVVHCPNCGKFMTYDPTRGGWACRSEWCGGFRKDPQPVWDGKPFPAGRILAALDDEEPKT